MKRYILIRTLMVIPILFLVSVVGFGLVLLIPGDPAASLAGENATPESLAAIRANLGLDRPAYVQYFDWLRGVLGGDLGTSLISRASVGESILERIPVTLSLAGLALLMGSTAGILAGVVSARRKDGLLDRFLTLVASTSIAMPTYWVALVLLLVFSLKFEWFPMSQYVPLAEDPVEWLIHLILPALALSVTFAAEMLRQVRSAMIEVGKKPYVTTARASGLRPRTITWKYMARNAALPAVTVLGMQFTRVLGGTVVIEQIFGLPGLGQYVVTAVLERDMPVIQGVVLATAVAAVLVNLLVDISYCWFDPRVRMQ